LKNAFGTFTGFKTIPVTSSSPFSFLANVNTTSNTTTSTTSTTTINTNNKNIESTSKASKTENISKVDDNTKTLSSTSPSRKIPKERENEKTKNNLSEYHAKLKGLNESVTAWIKSHVDANPFCILTPIFKDYENYLKEIKKENITTEVSHVEQTQVTQNDDKKDASIEKKAESSLFSSSNTTTTSTLTTDAEWKSEKSIFSSITTNTKPIFGNTEQKTESPKSVFGNTDIISDKSKSIFGNIESNVTGKSVFSSTTPDKNPFLRKSTESGKVEEEETNFPPSTFSFGQNPTTSNATAGFSFGR